MIASAPALDPNLDLLATLAQRLDPNFILWMFARGSNGKLAKRPASRDGRHLVSYKDPEHRGTFAQISAAYRALKRDGDHRFGIGCVLLDGPIVALDFDARPTLNPVVAEVFDRYPGYMERSVGHDGRHVIAGTRAPIKNFKNLPQGVEVIAYGFLTLTGHVIDGHREVLDATDLLADLDRRFRRTPGVVGEMHGVVERPKSIDPNDRSGCEDIGPDDLLRPVADTTDADLIALAGRAANGAKFSRLWAGDTTGYSSHSEADSALCCQLAFWTQGNRDRIDALFRQSGLMRDKWKRDDYRARTITRAIERTTGIYEPPRVEVVVGEISYE